LKQALQKAKAFGIHEVLLTCDEDNLGSIKVIEKNGGKLADKITAPGRSIQTCRFIVRFS
jgi:predicted acetyltransferase